MTPELQGADEAVGRLQAILDDPWKPVTVAVQRAHVAALLASHATLTAENEKLRGKVRKLEAEKLDHLTVNEDKFTLYHAAEAQLATARRALERLASMEAMTSSFSIAGNTDQASEELVARIDFAAAALAEKEPGP